MSSMVSAYTRGRAATREAGRGALSRRALLRGAGGALAGGVSLALAGCRGETRAAVPPVDVAALAERYTRLTLQLAKHQPSLVEAWFGPAAWREGPRIPAPTLRAEAAALLAEADRLPLSGTASSARARYVRGQIAALDLAAGRLLGDGPSFGEEARRAVGHVAPPRDAAALDAVRRRLADALPGPGTLAERHGAYRKAMAVPAERVEAVFAAAVDWCHTAARAHLPLPEGEHLSTRLADEAGWEAFSKPAGPRGSDVWIARRGSADAAHMLQLAAHEGTPGHHAQHVLSTAELVEGQGWTERSLLPSFGPHHLMAEGAAEAGADLLLAGDARERVCAELLLPAAGQSPARAPQLVLVERLAADLGMEVAYIANDYLDAPVPSADIADRLRDEALVLDPAGMVSFIEKQRTKVLAYPLGRTLVRGALDAAPAPDRWARFRAISTTLTLPE